MKIEFVKDELIQLYRVKTDPNNQNESFEVEMTDEEIKKYFITMNDFLCIQKDLATEHLKSIESKRSDKRELPPESLVRNHAFPEDDPRAFMKLSEIPKLTESGPIWTTQKL